MSKQRLCITPGDPLGIGPEITVKFLDRYAAQYQQPFHIIGSLKALNQAAGQLGVSLPQPGNVTYQDVTADSPGMISYLAIEQAVELLASRQADALVTGPIAKAHLQDAGIMAQGHTEILEFLARRHAPNTKPKAEMMFVYRNFRMLLLTRHIPLSRVASALASHNHRPALECLTQFLTRQAGIKKPRIAVLGVNPHAGEIGGVEETLILEPLIDEMNRQGHAQFEGPFAADAFFRHVDVNNLYYDAVVAMYHDQGLIPFKLIAGYKAVNVTVGLPFIRTSVSHGTAFDIAGQGVAKEESLVEAVDTAIELAAARTRSLHL